MDVAGAAGDGGAPPSAEPPAPPPSPPPPSAPRSLLLLAALLAVVLLSAEAEADGNGAGMGAAAAFFALPARVAAASAASAASAAASSAASSATAASGAAAPPRTDVALPSPESNAAAATIAWGAILDLVVYINTANATARDAAMQHDFLPAFGASGADIVRLEAFPSDDGMPAAQGTSLSHIAALQLALDGGYRSVLVLEDDCLWRVAPGRANLLLLEQLAAEGAFFDMVLLGGTFVIFSDAATHRIEHAYTTSSYLVAGHFLPTLMDNYLEGLHHLGDTRRTRDYALDVYWNRVIREARVLAVWPPLVIQDHHASLFGYPNSNDTRFDDALVRQAGRRALRRRVTAA